MHIHNTTMRLCHTVAVGILALTTTIDAAVSYNDFIQHHTLQSIPQGWSLKVDQAAEHIPVTYRIAVKQNQEAVQEIERYLLEVSSNPLSEQFGAHKSRAEVLDAIQPAHDSVQHITNWLIEHGISEYELTSNGYVKFNAPVSVGNKLFNTQYKVYQHENGKITVRTDSVSVPRHISEHIDFISPATRFPHARDGSQNIGHVDTQGKYHPLSALKSSVANGFGVHPHVKTAPAGVSTTPATATSPVIGLPPTPEGAATGVTCSQLVTPECFKQQYETANYVPTATSINALAVTGYIGQYYDVENLDAALATFTAPYQGPSALTYPAPPAKGDGGNPQGENYAGAEADLDVQATVQGAYPTPVTFYSTYYNTNYTGCGNGFPACNYPDEAGDDIYPLFFETIYNQPNVPPVISTSYGENESGMDPGYAQRVCQEVMLLTAQGISILYASGDGGVAGGQTGTCDGPNANLFTPTFPSGCPYLTSVGATTINADGSEQAATDPTIPTFSGSGGFSNLFARPSYQDSVVPQYLASLQANYPQYNGLYNASGRAFPDVSAIGVNYALYLSQTALTGVTVPSGTDVTPVLFRIDGTSVASPVFASVLALVNDYRLTTGRPVIGFLNPSIYAQPSYGWYDVTQGNNGCSGQCGCGTNGFYAVPGYDTATGLGTPRFSSLVQYLGNLGPVTGTPISTPTSNPGLPSQCQPYVALTGVSCNVGFTLSASGQFTAPYCLLTNPGAVQGCT